MNSKYLRRIQRRMLLRVICGYRTISYDSVYAISGFPPIDITILHDITFRENLSASSISNYDCILSPFFIPHPSERNAINIVQFSDKSTEDFPVISYTYGSKIDGRVGFAFVVFRSGVESENFQFRIRDECTVFVAELLFLNFYVKWITDQNSVISEYLICTDSLSSLDSLKCISSSNNTIVEIQKQLKSLRDKNISIDFAFVRGHTGVLGNERADWLAKAATKRKIDIDVNIPKSFYKKITNERMMKSWNQEYLISNKGSITKKFFSPLIRDYHVIIFYTNYKLTQFLTGHGCTEFMQLSILKEMTLPTYKGEINTAALGVSMQVLNDDGKPVIGEVGEIAITKPIPNLPVGLLNDKDGSLYREKYFSKYPAKPKGKEEQLAPTPRSCSAGCLNYRQCVLEECESDIKYRLIP
ncbi:acetoacetyl-CoA synthetase [Trichonephila clavipes]|nr:acetoacetyl-CoA synthetase [Trichonephila clavipes]